MKLKTADIAMKGDTYRHNITNCSQYPISHSCMNYAITFSLNDNTGNKATLLLTFTAAPTLFRSNMKVSWP